jgi:replication-associated recombination protein RarA
MLTPSQVSRNQSSTSQEIERILDSIPPPKFVKQTEKPCIIIIGKPGSGKTSLASKISKAMTTELVNLESIVLDMIQRPKESSSDNDETPTPFEYKVKPESVSEEVNILLLSLVNTK